VQADPNYLWFTPFGQPKQLLTRAGAGAMPVASRVTRIPSGHPEGYLEGFANIYAEAARAIRAARRKGGKTPKDVVYPTIDDGVEGVAFVEPASARQGKRRMDKTLRACSLGAGLSETNGWRSASATCSREIG
jgi:hypothetical protein